jgi:formylglycine-generating enzyme required for sulfatase activity
MPDDRTLKPDDEPPPPPPPPASPPLDVLPADLKYKLIRLIGYGNFGEVYEAEAPGGVRVAVKRILRTIDHPTGQSELAALEAMKTLSHPFLLQTQAYWVYRDQLIIVMELAEGSLDDRMEFFRKQGRSGIPPEELIPYFLQAAEALDYLHSLNVSHRDIKPQNLLYLKGYAKVADFGLARVHRHTQTTVGQLMGTPMYMAPEAWGMKISLHSDQYSLAATYVTARLGRGMFPSELVYELAMYHLEQAPDLNPLGEAEQAVLARALAKNPDDRYPSCRAFVEALRDAVLTPSVTVTFTPAAETPAPPAQRLPRWWIAVAVLGLLLFGGVAVWAVAFRDGNGTVLPTETLWCPAGWAPVEGKPPVTLDDGRKFHERLTRVVGGETLTAVAIAPRRPTDPPLFYILQDKVTNRVFKAVWDPAATNPNSPVATFRRNHGGEADALLPGKWKDGALTLKGEFLTIEGDQRRVPVLSVTMPEAAIVAEELGGQLPTPAQWEKALGVRDDPARGSSAGDPPFTYNEPPPRGLALSLTKGPWPVERKTLDVSIHGVHQLVSNGYEWTREAKNVEPFNLFDRQTLTPQMVVVGQSWDMQTVLTYAGIAAGTRNSHPWHDSKAGIGFRVVLEPK